MKALAGKHVLLIIENLAFPFDRRMFNIGTALRDFGAEVSVICPMSEKHYENEIVLDDIAVYRYKNTFANDSVLGYFREYTTAFVKTTFLLHKLLLQRRRIDVIHAANPPDIFWPIALYARLFGIKFIFDEHDMSPEIYLSKFEEGSDGLLLGILKWFQHLSYRFAHAVISTNESYKANALAVNHGYAAKTFVVRNGPDTRHFSYRAPNPALKQGHKYLGAYIGIMDVHDGVEYVIRAMDDLVNRLHYSDLIVYLIGKGEDWPRLKRLTEELGLGNHVVFTGRIPDEPALEILSTADVCLSPDPDNPLNNVSTMTKVMEYMALGKPIVSFKLKEAQYSAGESALYVKSNDAAAFADGILQILRDPVASKRMGEFAMARVETSLSWQKQTESLLRAYQFVAFGAGAVTSHSQ